MNDLDQKDLPDCDFRSELHTGLRYVCSHSGVRVENGLVTGAICRICSMRQMPSVSLSQDSAISITRNSHPRLISRGWSLAQAVAAFVSDGCRTLTAENYQARLSVCNDCNRRRKNRCLECGCNLCLKARGRTFRCPLDKWPK